LLNSGAINPGARVTRTGIGRPQSGRHDRRRHGNSPDRDDDHADPHQAHPPAMQAMAQVSEAAHTRRYGGDTRKATDTRVCAQPYGNLMVKRRY